MCLRSIYEYRMRISRLGPQNRLDRRRDAESQPLSQVTADSCSTFSQVTQPSNHNLYHIQRVASGNDIESCLAVITLPHPGHLHRNIMRHWWKHILSLHPWV